MHKFSTSSPNAWTPLLKALCTTCNWHDPVSTNFCVKLSCSFAFSLLLIALFTLGPSHEMERRSFKGSQRSWTVSVQFYDHSFSLGMSKCQGFQEPHFDFIISLWEVPHQYIYLFLDLSSCGLIKVDCVVWIRGLQNVMNGLLKEVWPKTMTNQVGHFHSAHSHTMGNRESPNILWNSSGKPSEAQKESFMGCL